MTRKFLPVLGRRDLLLYGGGIAVGTLVPVNIVACGDSPPVQTGFFTDAERAALGALANAVLPPDDTPGGKDLGAVAYIEKLCTAFDAADATHAPAIFAGGPFSGRMPFADDQGQPSTNFPPNSFANFLFLDRVKDAGWRLYIIGPSALPGGQPNVGVPVANSDGAVKPIVGLRDRLKQGLADAIKGSVDLGYGELATLSQSDLIAYLNKLPAEFHDLIVDLVQQASFSPPEYGGNANLGGWKLAHFEGDAQPLGYSVWSTAQNKYVERPDAPMSTPNASDPEPLTPDVIAFIDDVITKFPTYAKKFS